MRNFGHTLTGAIVGFCLLTAPAQRPEPSKTQPEARVDINHATVEDLAKVSGTTRVWTERVVRFRPYRAKNDLLDRGVVSIEVYERIRNWIVAHRDRQ